MVFNQQLFDTEKRKFGEALALDRDAKRAKLHADNQATETASAEAEAKKNAPPADMEKYFKPGQAIYRGDSGVIPADSHTPGQVIAGLFPGGQMTTGKSWSTHPAVAKRFSNRDWRGKDVIPEGHQQVRFTLHSEIDPKNVSFDYGKIEDDAGELRNWSSDNWKERHSGWKGHGTLGEEEVLMKTKSQVPITGITYRMGSMMNHHQFETPLTAHTSFPARDW